MRIGFEVDSTESIWYRVGARRGELVARFEVDSTESIWYSGLEELHAL